MKKNKNKKCTSIGGQAVLEGVMMRGAASMATAVRDEDGIIRIEAVRSVPLTKKNKFFALPIIRGIISFFSSLVGGMKTMMRSAEVYGESEPTKFEKWMAEKLKVNLMSVIIGISVLLGAALAIGLFIVVPTVVTGLFFKQSEHPVLYAVVEGALKILIFIIYIALTSLLKDIRRTYMYHGAEHKTISCYESGMDLTVENVKKCTRVHNRCGTTFTFFVLMISIIVLVAFNAVFPNLFVDDGFIGKLIRVLIKIALLPLVAGLSYELLKGLAKTDFWLLYPLKLPGLMLQLLTTREPDEGMMEVAITAFNKVLAMDADPNEPECKFVTAKKLADVVSETEKVFLDNGIDKSDAEWIISVATGIKRSELGTDKTVSPKNAEKIAEWTKERLSGRPLAYILGDVDFYGNKIFVNENVLIPRPETEELVEFACKDVKEGDRVLDLCTGSGAIAVTVKKRCTGACVFASDLSSAALAVAKNNAEQNGAEIEFTESDLFENITGKFNVIISNPPYIKTGDIPLLDPEVKNYEPRIALDGGPDGLDFYRRIAAEAYDRLEEGGILFLEIGEGQAEAVSALLNGYSAVEIKKDVYGTDRMIKAVK